MKSFLATFVIACLIYYFSEISLLYCTIIWLELFFLIYFLTRLGHKFVFLELLALIAVSQWLLGPMLSDSLGVRMEVSYAEYYAYAFPGTLLYVAGLMLPFRNRKKLDQLTQNVLDGLSQHYAQRHDWAIALIFIGLPCWLFQTVVPDSLKFIFYLLAHILMVGICLMMFTSYRWKYLWIAGGLGLLVITTLLNGMIGSVVFWFIIISVIYFSKNPRRISFISKAMFLILGIWILIALQATKTEYRILAWDIEKSQYSSRVSRDIKKDPNLFIDIFKEKILDPTIMNDTESKIALAGRLNQGMLVSYVMDYIPKRRTYAKGEVTIGNTLIAFVPRIFWPGKPVVGQREYFKAYTGVTLGSFVSATMGPIGDAYADFGRWGIIFLGCFGLLLSRIYMWFIKTGQTDPAVLLWFMIIYFGSLTVAEVSVSGYLNALFKFFIFIFAIRFLLQAVFKIKV